MLTGKYLFIDSSSKETNLIFTQISKSKKYFYTSKITQYIYGTKKINKKIKTKSKGKHSQYWRRLTFINSFTYNSNSPKFYTDKIKIKKN